MKLIYKIVFIFCLFILSLGINISNENAFAHYEKEDILFSYSTPEFDITNKDNAETITNECFNQSVQNSARTKTLSLNGFCGDIKGFKNQFKRIISYIYSKSYLDKIQNQSLILISSEISPQAP